MARVGRARYTLRADVSECYRSIYTHSLEWALHTKAAAKANIHKKGPHLLGGELDFNVRNGQDGQTKGLPIGPDTSLLLAEIILCAIDSELQVLHPDTQRFSIRFMDDLEFFAQSRGEAEDVLLGWDALLNSYDLSLNPMKTEIVEGPIPPEFTWRVHLSQLQLRSGSDAALTNDLHSLFSLAFELAKQNPGDAVLSYAVNRVRPRPAGLKSWEAFSNLLLAAVTAEPSSLRFVSSALNWARKQDLSINSGLVADTLNSMCFHHAPLEHGSEVAWSLAIMRDLDLPLSSEAAARVAHMQDNCSLLLLFDFLARKRISGTDPDMSGVVSRAEDPAAWKSEDWLLAYECGRNGWANDRHFQAEPHWAELRRLGVSFFTVAAPEPAPTSDSAPTPAPADEYEEEEEEEQEEYERDEYEGGEEEEAEYEEEEEFYE